MSKVNSYGTAVSRGARIVIMVLLTLSLVSTILHIVPAANYLYWPAVAVSMELWPWFIIVNLFGLLLVRLRSKIVAVIFALGLVIAIWPFFSVSGTTASVEEQWKRHYPNVLGLRVPDSCS